MYTVSTYDKDTYEQIRTGVNANSSAISSAKDENGLYDPDQVTNAALKKAADPLYGYFLPQKDFTIPKINGVYNRGVTSQRLITGMKGVEDGTPSSILTTGNFHFSAYWRQNLLTILMNGGSNAKFGAKTENTIAVFATGTPAKDSKGDMILKNAVTSDTATISGIKWNIDSKGNITRETDSVADNNGFVTDTRTYDANGNAKSGYEKIHLVPVEGSVDLIDGNYLNTGKAGIQLYIPDYHLVKDNEWITNDKSVSSTASQGIDKKSYTESKTFTSTQFADSALQAGDKEITLYGNWAPNYYTITYDVGGKVNANISASVADANIKPVLSGRNNNRENISKVSGTYKKGRFDSYTATQLYTVETKGNIPEPSRKFYDFGGWFIADGSADAPTIRDRNKDGKITEADRVKTYADLLSETPTDDRNIRLVAEWTPRTYELTYNIGAMKSSVMDLVYNTYIRDPAHTTKSAILGTEVVSKSGLDQSFTDRNSKDFKITYSIEADGNLAESHTDYVTIAGYDNYWGKSSSEPYTSGVYTYNALLDYLSSGSTLSSTVYRQRQGYIQSFSLIADLGTADLTTLSASFNTTNYNITSNLTLSGANLSEGSGTPEAYNDSKSYLMKPASDTFSNVSISISQPTGVVTYGTKSFSFTVEDVNKSIPTTNVPCHTFNGWHEKSKGRNVSVYGAFRDELPKTGSTTVYVQNGAGNAFKACSHENTSTYTYATSTCVKKGLKITYCTVCKNVTGTSDIDTLSPTGQHDWHRHTHLVKNTSGTIIEYKVVETAPKNANTTYGGSGDSNGAYSAGVPRYLGGPGTCYNGEQMMIEHRHTASCFTGQTAKTEEITIREDDHGFGFDVEDELKHKIMSLTFQGHGVVSVREKESDSSTTKCPICNNTNFDSTGRCKICGYKDSSLGHSPEISGSNNESTTYVITYYDSCNQGYNRNDLKQIDLRNHGESYDVIGMYRGYRLSCDQRYDRMCFADAHDIYTCKYCGEKEERGYEPAYGSHNMAAEDWGVCATGVYHRDYCTRGDYSNIIYLGATHMYKWVTTSNDFEIQAGYWNGSGGVENGWVTDGWLSTRGKARENAQDVIKKRLDLGSRPSLTYKDYMGKNYSGGWWDGKFTYDGNLRVEHGVYFKKITAKKKYKYAHYNLSQNLEHEWEDSEDSKVPDQFHIASLHIDTIEYKCAICGAAGTAPSAPSFNFDTGRLN